MFRIIIRLFLFTPLGVTYIVTNTIASFLLHDRRKWRFITWFSSWCARVALRIFGVHVRVYGKRPANDGVPVFIVSNHISYIDIVAIASVMRVLFTTSVELGNTFVMGLFARAGGSIFVERRKKSGLRKEIETISSVLVSKTNVVLFPESTTSDGKSLLPFKSAFFAVPEKTSVPILPICVSYTGINGRPLDENSGRLIFYRGKHFLSHLKNLLSVKRIDMQVSILDTVESHNKTRKVLCEGVFAVIDKAYSEAKQM